MGGSSQNTQSQQNTAQNTASQQLYGANSAANYGQNTGQNVVSTYAPSDLAQGYLAAGSGGLSNLARYQNPYQAQVTGATMGQLGQLFGQQQSQVVGNAASNNALGGSRQAVAQGVLAGQQGLAAGSTLAGLNNQGYNVALTAAQNEAARNLQAAGMAGGTTSGQSLGSTLGSTANTMLGQMNAASASAGSGSGASSTTTDPGAMGYMGMGLGLLGMFSDERLKDDARVVGKTFDGQDIYSYRYKGDNTTHLGMMAQDVEQRHPEAVGGLGGLKTVRYDIATKDAADKGGFADGGGVGQDEFLREMMLLSQNTPKADASKVSLPEAPRPSSGGGQGLGGKSSSGKGSNGLGGGLSGLFASGGSVKSPSVSLPELSAIKLSAPSVQAPTVGMPQFDDGVYRSGVGVPFPTVPEAHVTTSGKGSGGAVRGFADGGSVYDDGADYGPEETLPLRPNASGGFNLNIPDDRASQESYKSRLSPVSLGDLSPMGAGNGGLTVMARRPRQESETPVTVVPERYNGEGEQLTALGEPSPVLRRGDEAFRRPPPPPYSTPVGFETGSRGPLGGVIDQSAKRLSQGLGADATQVAQPPAQRPIQSAYVLSPNGIDFIKSKEGFSSSPYSDYKQTSIGYGTRANVGETTIDQKEAERRLASEARPVADWLTKNVKVPLTQSQVDGLTSFGYNLGTGALNNLRDDINSGNWEKVASRMRLYNKAGGKTLSALVNRRQQESDMVTGSYEPGSVQNAANSLDRNIDKTTGVNVGAVTYPVANTLQGAGNTVQSVADRVKDTVMKGFSRDEEPGLTAGSTQSGRGYANERDQMNGGLLKSIFGINFNPLNLSPQERMNLIAMGGAMAQTGNFGAGLTAYAESARHNMQTDRQTRLDALDMQLKQQDLEQKRRQANLPFAVKVPSPYGGFTDRSAVYDATAPGGYRLIDPGAQDPTSGAQTPQTSPFQPASLTTQEVGGNGSQQGAPQERSQFRSVDEIPQEVQGDDFVNAARKISGVGSGDLATAQAVATYKSDLRNMTMRGDRRQIIENLARRINPNYDPAKFPAVADTEKRLASGDVAKALRSIGRLFDEVEQTSALVDQTGNSRSQTFNEASSPLWPSGSRYGVAKASLGAALNNVVDTASAVAKGGGQGAEGDAKRRSESMNANQAPEALKAALRVEAEVGLKNGQSNLASYNTAHGYEPGHPGYKTILDYLTPPQRVKALKLLGRERLEEIIGRPLSTKDLPGGGGGRDVPTGPAAAISRPNSVPQGSQYSPSRKMWRDASGKLYDQTGAPVQ